MESKKGNILIGVSASIAIYKSLEVISLLKKRGFSVKVAMTKEASNFISPVVFEALTNSRVYLDVLEEFDNPDDTNITHIALAKWADVFAVIPATSNIIAKIANGLSDDAVSLLALASEAKKLIAPAMNSSMYLNSITQDNIEKLKKHGFKIVEPVEGDLACNTKGVGHIADVCDIVDAVESLLSEKILLDKKVIVTAGPTVEAIDPVRFITNKSSGKMGYAVAKAALDFGACVTLISGPSNLRKPFGVDFVSVNSALEMLNELKKRVEDYGDCIVVMAAAVSDFKPKHYEKLKIKKSNGNDKLILELIQNPDLTKEINKFAKEKRIRLFTVGFAAETDNLLNNAMEKIKKKGLEFIVANDVSRNDIGFNTDENEVSIIYKDGKLESLPKMSKYDVACEILRRIK